MTPVRVRCRDDGALGDGRVSQERLFDFRAADVVARRDDHVVPARDVPEIAILIAAEDIARQVPATANVILLAGVVELRPDVISEEGRVFLFVGLLGGFTTFSAFGLDTLQLMRGNATGFALLNVGLQVTLGLLAVWAGMEALRFFVRA